MTDLSMVIWYYIGYIVKLCKS